MRIPGQSLKGIAMAPDSHRLTSSQHLPHPTPTWLHSPFITTAAPLLWKRSKILARQVSGCGRKNHLDGASHFACTHLVERKYFNIVLFLKNLPASLILQNTKMITLEYLDNLSSQKKISRSVFLSLEVSFNLIFHPVFPPFSSESHSWSRCWHFRRRSVRGLWQPAIPLALG